MSNSEVSIAVVIIALTTALIRALPFLVFRNGQKTPRLVSKLSKSLPLAIMGMLVVYCLKDVTLTSPQGFLPALIACAVTAVLHLLLRNTLLSIISGTVCYMVLVQMVFI